MQLSLSLSLTGRLLSSFLPIQLFSTSEPGVWLDPSDLPTLFQDTAGTQPVTAAGQTVALALDKSKGLALGPELFANQASVLDNSGGGATITHTAATRTVQVTVVGASTSYPRLQVSMGMVTGRRYSVSGRIDGDRAAVASIRLALTGTANNLAYNSSTGVFSGIQEAGASPVLEVLVNGTQLGTVTIATISVRELPGIHATQSILASRPLYALHPSSGIRNLANGSADVGNTTYWPASIASNGITATKVASGIDTDGLPYVDYSVVGTASANSFVPPYNTTSSRTPAFAGQTLTCSFVAQLIAGSQPPANCGVRPDIFGETTAPAVSEGFSAAASISAAPTTLSLTSTLASGTTVQARGNVTIRTESGATVNYTVRIKALQFEFGSARTNYQFNYANFNIAEAPFAQVGNFLFDGIDDFLVTPTITPNTDKVQVFAGVRKRSDAARGVLVELTSGGNGRFTMEAPPAAAPSYSFNSIGTVLATATSGNLFASPDTSVLTGLGDISGDSAALRRNGSQVATSATDQGTGNYSNAIVYIGRRGGTTLPFNGRLYGLVVRFGPNLDAATIAATEAWMNTKTGAY